MKTAFYMLAAAAAVAVTTAPAAAATMFSTMLSGANETAPNNSAATGSGTLLLSTNQNSIDVFLSWNGLTGPATGGHVHCCAFQGADVSVAIDFGPSAVATGSLTRSYDLTVAGTFTNGFINANGGTVASARTAFVNGLNIGRAYYNVHTAIFARGEIRGQLAAVPETATWGMMIAGFGMVGGAMRMRRRTVALA